MADYESMSQATKGGVEAELQDFIMMEKQRMQVTQQVRNHHLLPSGRTINELGSELLLEISP